MDVTKQATALALTTLSASWSLGYRGGPPRRAKDDTASVFASRRRPCGECVGRVGAGEVGGGTGIMYQPLRTAAASLGVEPAVVGIDMWQRVRDVSVARRAYQKICTDPIKGAQETLVV